MSHAGDAHVLTCRHCGTVVPAGVAFCSRCGASIDPPKPTGDPLFASLRELFAHELEFEHELGRGGMAAVYAAFDPALQRRVAVKALLPDIAQEPEAVVRFLREARTVAALQHPNIVSVFGVRAGEGVSAIIMQYVEGRSLDIILKERSPLPIAVAGLLLSEIAAGLQHAHDRGVVHRDVKPANVLIDREGGAVVSDFGIARREGHTRITGTGVVVGSLAYMSPEQRTADEPGPASDQYAFGVMAFEMLAGRLPFQGTPQQMLHAHLTAPPPSLRALRSEISPAIESLVLRMLEKDPAARFRNLHEVERVFRPLIADSNATTLVVAGYSRGPRKGESRVLGTVTALSPAVGAPRTLTRPRMAIAAVLVVAAVALLWAVTPRSRPDAAAPGTSAPSATGAGGETAQRASRSASGPAAASGRTATREEAVPKPAVASTPGSLPGTTVATPAVSPSAHPLNDAGAAREGITTANGAGTAAGRADAPVDAPPRVAPAASLATTAATATTADARAVAREFVTLLNQRRWHEVEQLGELTGDAALRAEVVRLTHDARDFSAGFDRVASPPEVRDDGFFTEFVVDLEWRGGRRLALVHLRAVAHEGTWRVAAFGMDRYD